MLNLIKQNKSCSINSLKNGFTLSEVLITLGVIGVVAAMTLPSVINHHKKTSYLNLLKQTYSQMMNAVELEASYQELLPMDKWQCEQIVDGIDYGTRESCLHNAIKRVASKMYPYTSESPCYEGGTVKKIYTKHNVDLGWSSQSGCRSAQFPNGACVAWCNYTWTGDLRARLFIDVDGPYKGKNIIGSDVYAFQYAGVDWGTGLGENGREIVPDQIYTIDNKTGAVNTSVNRSAMIDNCKKYGYRCSGLIITDGWHMEKDYPW